MILYFGNCRLDLRARQLFRGPAEVHLSPKAFAVLQLLVESRPRALGKEEVLARVWTDTFVSESSLSVVIAELRSALGDDARRPRLLRTVHRFGYAFAGPVREEAEDLAGRSGDTFWLTWASREFRLQDGENVIGRDAPVEIRLDSPAVSRRHARITVCEGQAVLEDLSSKNGTSLRGLPLDAPAVLADGDEIQIGSFDLVFRVAKPAAPTDTAPGPRQRKTAVTSKEVHDA